MPHVELRLGAFSNITRGVIGAYYFDVRLVRVSLRIFRLSLSVLSMLISVVSIDFGLSSIWWQFFSACSPPLSASLACCHELQAAYLYHMFLLFPYLRKGNVLAYRIASIGFGHEIPFW